MGLSRSTLAIFALVAAVAPIACILPDYEVAETPSGGASTGGGGGSQAGGGIGGTTAGGAGGIGGTG